MLGLSATLRAAQQQFDVDPVVAVLVADVAPETLRLSEQALVYSGSEGDAPFDACQATDGRFGRIRTDGYGNVWVQVVDPPRAPGNWSSWTQVAGGASGYAAGWANGPVAIGAFSDGYFRARWLNADGHSSSETTLAYSAGASWSAAALAQNGDVGAGKQVQGIGCDGSEPTPRFIYVVGQGALYETHLQSGAWTVLAGDGGTYTGNPTIGVGYRATTAPNGDGNVYVLVACSNPSQLLLRRYNTTSGNWDASVTVRTAGLSTGYSYSWPRLAETRADQLRQVITWYEVPPAPLPAGHQLCVTPTHTALTHTIPWYPVSDSPAATHGVRVLKDHAAAPRWWLFTSSLVYTLPADFADTASGQRIAFAQDQIVDARLDQPGPNHAGSAVVAVLNDGSLADAGQAGRHRGLRQWSQLALKLGYHTSAGDELVTQEPLWIESVVFRDDVTTGQGLVIFHCLDSWGLLDRLVCQFPLVFTNATLDTILKNVWWNVSGDLDLIPSSLLTGITLPSFTVRAGETFGAAARRLCERAGVVVRFRTNSSSADGTGWDSSGVSVVAWATGGSAYSYGPAAHPIVQADVAPLTAPSATSVEVVGKSTTSLARALSLISLLGHEVPARIVDKTLDSQAKTDSVASQMATLLVPESRGGEITTLANVGLEVGDQIDLTIPSAPISGQVYTVAGIVTSYSREHGLVQTLKLEGSN